MKTFRIQLFIIALLGTFLIQQTFAQSSANDSSFHPYHVNYLVTGSICGVGFVANYIGIPKILGKPHVDSNEIKGLNQDLIVSFDRWALTQDPSQMGTFGNYSDYTLMVSVALPGLLLFDKKIMKDWFDVLLIYLETMSITPNIYEWSFLGPTFQDKFRPITYYNELSYEQRKEGNNRNSFYSGHVATVAASTFFMVKVYSDYNPGIGDNKYLLYGAATIPPLILGYFRVKALKHFPSDVMVGLGVGAFCGIIIPEFHRINDKNISLEVYSSQESTGITLKWHPEFLK